jgi:hypothetical protein
MKGPRQWRPKQFQPQTNFYFMITKITLLTALSFAALYPFCFLISFRDPLKNNFHHFHIGLPAVTAALIFIFTLNSNIPPTIKLMLGLWSLSLLLTAFYYWKKNTVGTVSFVLCSVLGIIAFLELQSELISPGIPAALAGMLAGLIFSSVLFAMNLGHWYLNVHGLPIIHLKRASYIFWIFLALRLTWDSCQILTASVYTNGESVALYKFIVQMDGIFLLIALFFGTLFPFFSMFFVREILKLKNTQATTGVLYVILCAVLLGDIAYKYYFLKYGLFL